MYFQLFIFSIVSAAIINSDLTSSFEDIFSQDALPSDQITLDSNLLGSPLDTTSPLFDAESPSTDDTFNELDLFDSSSLFRDDTFQIADCSTSDIPSALDKSRVKRSDDAASCSNSANSDDLNIPTLMVPQNFDPEKQSDTCWQLTLGLLPFAVVYSGDVLDRIRDTTKKYIVTSTSHRFSPVTLRRASLIVGVAPFYASGTGWQVYCCQYIKQFYVYLTRYNCVGLWDIWDDENSVGVPLKDFE